MTNKIPEGFAPNEDGNFVSEDGTTTWDPASNTFTARADPKYTDPDYRPSQDELNLNEWGLIRTRQNQVNHPPEVETTPGQRARDDAAAEVTRAEDLGLSVAGIRLVESEKRDAVRREREAQDAAVRAALPETLNERLQRFERERQEQERLLAVQSVKTGSDGAGW